MKNVNVTLRVDEDLKTWMHPKREKTCMDLMTAFLIGWRHSMLKVAFTGQFKKDYKLAVKRGCDPYRQP